IIPRLASRWAPRPIATPTMATPSSTAAASRTTTTAPPKPTSRSSSEQNFPGSATLSRESKFPAERKAFAVHSRCRGQLSVSRRKRMKTLAIALLAGAAALSVGSARASDIYVSEEYASPDLVQQVRTVCDEYG